MTSDVLVRTKSGRKTHVSPSGSSRTICGARRALAVKWLSAIGFEGCAACGISPNATAAEVGKHFGVEVL